jgi:hypothetical protein
MRTEITKDCLFAQEKVEKTFSQNEYYCFSGQEDYIDSHNNPRLNKEDHRTLAKKIILDNKYKLYIKVDENKNILNPMSIYSEKYKHLQNLKKFKDCSYKLVGPKAFNYYIKFLKTKNISWLYNTERESE